MNNRVALVTGSASGLGVQSVLSLAQQGFNLVINYRKSIDAASKLKQQVEDTYGVRCVLIQGDITHIEDCQRMVAQSLIAYGRLDILVNNAGPYIFERKKMVEYTYQEWEQIMTGNLSSVFYLAKEVIPIMRKNKWGRIINFGFNHAGQATGWIHRSAFASAKVGLVSLTKTLAQEECDQGITVNMICPGDIVGENKEKTIMEVREMEGVKNTAPVGRVGSGEDISRIVSFLCAEDSDFITGSIIEVTGAVDVLRKREGKVT